MLLTIAAAYLLLSIFMTSPLLLHFTSALPGTSEDTSYLHWALAWDLHKIGEWLGLAQSSASHGGFWDANIFAPLKKTLARGDHLLGILPLAFLPWLITGDVTFSYNVTFLLTFFLSGFGMFLLVRHLLGAQEETSTPAAFVSGIIFAYLPYRFSQLGYLEILSSEWFPFLLLTWHLFLEKGRKVFLVLLGLFLFLQALSSPYLGVYALFLLVLMTALYGVRERNLLRILFPLGTAVLLVGVILFPLHYPYLEVKKAFGIFPGGATWWSATLFSFFTAPAINHFWGWSFLFFGKGTATSLALFPGVTTLFLAFLGIRSCLSESGDTRTPVGNLRGETTPVANVLLLRLLEMVLLLLLCLLVFILVTGGAQFTLLGERILVRRAVVPSSLFLFFGILRILLDQGARRWILRLFRRTPTIPFLYLVLLFSGCLFTFYLPYQILMRSFPGFAYLRITGRIFVLATIALSVLAGYGVSALLRSLRSLGRNHPPVGEPALPWHTRSMLITVMLLAFLLGEFSSSPLPLSSLPFLPEGVPPVYRWLASLHEDPVVLELPISPRFTPGYLYASTFHWKRLVNGLTGLVPSYYSGLSDVMERFPSSSSLQAIQELGVRYILLHKSGYGASEWGRVKKKLRLYPEIIFVKGFLDAEVYSTRLKVPPQVGLKVSKISEISEISKILPQAGPPKAGPPQAGLKFPAMSRDMPSLKILPREGWTVGAYPIHGYFNRPDRVLDGKLETRWSTDGPQRSGDFLLVDFRRVVTLKRVSLDLASSGSDYPRNFQILVSLDGKRWNAIREVKDPPPPLTSYFQSPTHVVFSVDTPAMRARLLKISITKDAASFWSVCEVNCFGP